MAWVWPSGKVVGQEAQNLAEEGLAYRMGGNTSHYKNVPQDLMLVK
jgi:hypothetical protein